INQRIQDFTFRTSSEFRVDDDDKIDEEFNLKKTTAIEISQSLKQPFINSRYHYDKHNIKAGIIPNIKNNSLPYNPIIKTETSYNKILSNKLVNNKIENSSEDFKFESFSSSLIDTIQEAESKLNHMIGLSFLKDENYIQALPWIKSSSELGNEKAQFNLALCYEQGLGVEKNLNKAKEYYLMSAEAGHSLAQYNLGIFYANGFGGEKSIHKSKYYLKLASLHKHIESDNKI
ncbi:unnamed protein product, partial [Gordionus sp. m RMFG-2023]